MRILGVFRIRRRGRWILAGVGLLLVLLAVIGWMLFQHIPSWYQPTPVSAAELQRVKDDLLASFDRLSRLMNGDRPFEFRLTDAQLNAWLSARDQIWPEAQRWVPPEIDQPFVAFADGRVLLAGTLDWQGVRTVLSLSFEVAADEQGLALRLVDVSGGSLSLPDSLVERQLARIDAHRRRHDDGADFPPAADLLRGTHMRCEFVWPNGKRRFRVRMLRIEPYPRR